MSLTKEPSDLLPDTLAPERIYFCPIYIPLTNSD